MRSACATDENQRSCLRIGRRARAPRERFDESIAEMPTMTGRANYHTGTLYALATATLLALQEPFSALAARSLSSAYFIGFTQVALMLSVPLLVLRRDALHDFIELFRDAGNIAKLAVLFAVGMAGLFLYNIGLSS